MRDKSHSDQVERWARYVKENSDWKKKLKPFLDSQIIISNRFYKKIAQTPKGAEKIKLLRRLK